MKSKPVATTLPEVVVKKAGADRLRQGLPWVFRSDIHLPPVPSSPWPSLAPWVQVVDQRKNAVAVALWSDEGPLALRRWGNPQTPTDHTELASRLTAAIRLREMIANGAVPGSQFRLLTPSRAGAREHIGRPLIRIPAHVRPIRAGEGGVPVTAQRHGNAKQVRAWENGMTGVYEGMGNLTLAMVPDEEIAAHASESLVRRHATVTGRPDSAAKAVASHRSVGTRERMNSNAALRQEVNTRAFGATYTGGAITGVDRAKTKKAVKNDVFAAKNVATADLTGDMSSAIADAYNDKHVLENLVDQYMVSDADGKREMDASVLSNVFESFGREEAEARRSGDTAREAMFASQRAALATDLEAVRGGNANMVAEIMGHLTDLAAEQTRLSGLPRPTAEDRRALDRVTDDITRLRSRRRLH